MTQKYLRRYGVSCQNQDIGRTKPTFAQVLFIFSRNPISITTATKLRMTINIEMSNHML